MYVSQTAYINLKYGNIVFIFDNFQTISKHKMLNKSYKLVNHYVLYFYYICFPLDVNIVTLRKKSIKKIRPIFY